MVKLHRREILAATASGLVAAACGGRARPAPAPSTVAAQPAPKRILILGGTGFLGPATIEAALARGHQVTIFNRGKREKLVPLEHGDKVEHLYGNRDPELTADDENPASPKGLTQLVGRTWDAVIDNSGFYPRLVKASAELLGKAGVGQYIFISSISAYAEYPAAGGDETTKLATVEDPSVETMGDQFQNYGGFKVMCEQAAEAAMPGKVAAVRPGYIVGPGDSSDRFTYWPVRIARGGEVLIPGSPEDPLQWIDVRDLAAWLVKLVEQHTTGVFNAVGPATPGRWGDVVDAMLAAAPGATPVWVPVAWLAGAGAGGEDAFPIWTAPVGETAGFHRWKNDRAKAAGLTFRPVRDTVDALLAWYPGEVERRARVAAELEAKAKAAGKPSPAGGADPKALRAGPAPEREAALLAAFKANPTPKPAPPVPAKG